MFKNKINGKNNICGEQIKKLRLNSTPKMSQRALADKPCEEPPDVSRRIRSGQTDRLRVYGC